MRDRRPGTRLVSSRNSVGRCPAIRAAVLGRRQIEILKQWDLKPFCCSVAMAGKEAEKGIAYLDKEAQI